MPIFAISKMVMGFGIFRDVGVGGVNQRIEKFCFPFGLVLMLPALQSH